MSPFSRGGERGGRGCVCPRRRGVALFPWGLGVSLGRPAQGGMPVTLRACFWGWGCPSWRVVSRRRMRQSKRATPTQPAASPPKRPWSAPSAPTTRATPAGRASAPRPRRSARRCARSPRRGAPAAGGVSLPRGVRAPRPRGRAALRGKARQVHGPSPSFPFLSSRAAPASAFTRLLSPGPLLFSCVRARAQPPLFQSSLPWQVRDSSGTAKTRKKPRRTAHCCTCLAVMLLV